MKIKEIAIINPSSKDKYFDYINYIDTSSVFDGKLLNTQFLSKSYPSRAQRKIKYKDILISSVRPNLLHNYYVTNEIDHGIASTGFIQVRVESNKYIPRFVYYFLTSKKNISKYSSIADASQTTFPTFNKDIIENLEIPDYDINKQHYIVDIIGSIDDKIENNNKIIDNNYKMLNLEMKKYIKNEWIKIGDNEHISFIKSGINNFDGKKVYLDTSSVSNYSIIDESYIITYEQRPSRANMQPIEDSIWFAKLKNSPKYIIVKDYSIDLINNKIFSTGFCGLKIDKDFFNLVSTYITSEEFNKNKDQLCIGATMQGVNNSDISNIIIPNFNEEDCINFNLISNQILLYIYNLNEENKNLLKLKDLYLKKFFS
jgi:putative type-1 restriction enzyme hindVIIP specificity protein